MLHFFVLHKIIHKVLNINILSVRETHTEIQYNVKKSSIYLLDSSVTMFNLLNSKLENTSTSSSETETENTQHIFTTQKLPLSLFNQSFTVL